MRFGGRSRDDTDDFFVVFLMKSMNDQKNRTRPYGSDGYPTFLILESDVTLRNREGIVESENGRVEANSVLLKVLPVLLVVPFKSHGSPRLRKNAVLAGICQYICMYSIVYAGRAQKVGIDTRTQRREISKNLAERVGFEPTVRFPVRSLSRRVLSTAQPPLRGRFY